MDKEIVNIVLPVFLIIGLGYCLKRVGVIKASVVFELTRLIYYVALPALLFYKIGQASFAVSFNGILVAGLVTSTFIICLCSYIYCSLKKYPSQVKGAFCQGTFRGNIGYMGLALAHSAYGESGLALAGILIGFIVPFFNVLTVLVLNFARDEGKLFGEPASLIREIVGNPLIVACFTGVIWSYFNFPLPSTLDRTLGLLTPMSLPLALICVGASFSLKKLQGDLGVALAVSSIKLVLMPILAGMILYWWGVRGQELGVGLLFAGSPTATMAYIMAQQMHSDAELSGAIIMLSTLLSMVSFTIILIALHSL